MDLINRLSILTVKENETGNIATTIATDSAFQSAEDDSSNLTMDEQHYVKESLAVFRKSAHAAASILAAFRARSFCQRQLAKSGSDISDSVLDIVADSLSKVQNMYHFEDYLHFAALKIQKRYRGWKGRKDFLKIRNRIVKIQVLCVMKIILMPAYTLYHIQGNAVYMFTVYASFVPICQLLIILFCDEDSIRSSVNNILLYRLVSEDSKFKSNTKKLCGLLALWKKQYFVGDGKELVCEDSREGSRLALMNMTFLVMGGDRNQMM